MWLCSPDIAITVFNKCTTDNNGKTVKPQDVDIVVTRDSPYFEVTFDYEFLEDFRQTGGPGITYRSDDTNNPQHGYSDGEVVTSNDDDETDGGFFSNTTSVVRKYVRGETWVNHWGPEGGFNKQNHPLSIMVCVL